MSVRRPRLTKEEEAAHDAMVERADAWARNHIACMTDAEKTAYGLRLAHERARDVRAKEKAR